MADGNRPMDRVRGAVMKEIEETFTEDEKKLSHSAMNVASIVADEAEQGATVMAEMSGVDHQAIKGFVAGTFAGMGEELPFEMSEQEREARERFMVGYRLAMRQSEITRRAAGILSMQERDDVRREEVGEPQTVLIVDLRGTGEKPKPDLVN